MGKKDRLQEKRGEAKRACLKDEGETMSGWVNAKTLQENLKSIHFTMTLTKSKMGKEVGGRGASDRIKRRGKDERQPMIAAMAAR